MLLCVVFGWLIVVGFLVIFSSSKDDTSEDTPATRHPFSLLHSLVQQLRSSGPLLGWAVQAASSSVTTSLSRSVTGGGGGSS